MTATVTSHVDTVTAIYQAFATGDVPAILERLAPDVSFDADWPSHSAQQAGVTHLMPRRGREGAAQFFAVIGSWTVDAFVVEDVLASATQVVAAVHAAFTLPNGGRFADDELHLWTFGPDGLVTRFRHYVDTAKHIAAHGGADTVG